MTLLIPVLRKIHPAWLVFSVFSLSLLTWLLFLNESELRYQTEGSNLLANSGFQKADMGAWHQNRRDYISIDPEQGLIDFELPKTGKTETVSIFQSVQLHASKLVKVKAAAKAAQIKTDSVSWHGGRLLVVSLSSQGKPIYHHPHVAAREIDTNGWITISKIFKIPNDINHVRVVAQLVALSGKFAVKNLALFTVTERETFLWAKNILLLCWCALLFFGLLSLLFSGSAARMPWFPVSIVVIILIGVLLSQQHFRTLFSYLEFNDPVQSNQPDVNNLAPETPGRNNHADSSWRKVKSMFSQYLVINTTFENRIKKVGHLVLFALLFWALVYSNQQALQLWRIWMICFLIAMSSEMMQFFTEGRTPTLRDLGIDILGFSIAGLAFLVSKWIRNR